MMPRVDLTDRFAARVKPGAQRTDYFDENSPGLALRVAKGGKRTWTFHFTSPKDGKRIRMNLGHYPGTTLAGARTLAIEAKGYLDAKLDPRDAFASQRASELTVAGLWS